MARMRARLGEPSDGLPPVSGTAAGCTAEADAATLALAETEAEAVVVGVADALGVGVSDAVGVGVSVGITPASAFGASDARPVTMKAPTITTTRPATKIRPIPFSFRYLHVSGTIAPNEPAPLLVRAAVDKL